MVLNLTPLGGFRLPTRLCSRVRYPDVICVLTHGSQTLARFGQKCCNYHYGLLNLPPVYLGNFKSDVKSLAHSITSGGSSYLRLRRLVWTTSSKCSSDLPRVHPTINSRSLPSVKVGDLVEFNSFGKRYELGIVTCSSVKGHSSFSSSQLVVTTLHGNDKIVKLSEIDFKIPGWAYKTEKVEPSENDCEFYTSLHHIPARCIRNLEDLGIHSDKLNSIRKFYYKTRDLMKSIKNPDKVICRIHSQLETIDDKTYISLETIGFLLFKIAKSERKLEDEELYATLRFVKEYNKYFLIPHPRYYLSELRQLIRRPLLEVEYVNSLASHLSPVITITEYPRFYPHQILTEKCEMITSSGYTLRTSANVGDIVAECKSVYPQGLIEFIESLSGLIAKLRKKYNLEDYLLDKTDIKYDPTSKMAYMLMLLMTRMMVLPLEFRGLYLHMISNLVLPLIEDSGDKLSVCKGSKQLWSSLRCLLVECGILQIWGGLSYLFNPRGDDLRYLAPSFSGPTSYITRKLIEYATCSAIGVRTCEEKLKSLSNSEGNCKTFRNGSDVLKCIDAKMTPNISGTHTQQDPEYWIIRAKAAYAKILKVSESWRSSSAEEAVNNYYHKYLYPDIHSHYNTISLSAEDFVYEKDPNYSTRTDYTHLECYAIDSSNSFEIDDAISYEELADGTYWIHVHVADPTSFIKASNLLVSALSNRFSSLYLKRQGHLLFTNDFSKGLDLRKCDRALTFSAKLGIGGFIVESSVCASNIKKANIITYSEADSIMTKKINNEAKKTEKSKRLDSKNLEGVNTVGIENNASEEFQHEFERTASDLIKMYNLVQRHRFRRKERGACNSDNFISSRYSVSSGTNSKDVVPGIEGIEMRVLTLNGTKDDVRSRSKTLVEECMIIANRVAANYCLKNSIPVYYRGTDPQTYDAAIKNVMLSINSTNPFHENGNSDTDYKSESSPAENVSTYLKNNPSAASIATFPIPHPSVGIPGLFSPEQKSNSEYVGYVQATSPMRRFTDLIVHFNIRAHMLNQTIPFTEQNLRNNLKHVKMKELQFKNIPINETIYWNLMWIITQELKTSSDVKKSKSLSKLFKSGSFAFRQLDGGITYVDDNLINDCKDNILGPIPLRAGSRINTYKLVLRSSISYYTLKRTRWCAIQASLVDINRVFVKFTLPESELNTLDLYPGKTIDAVVNCIIPSYGYAVFSPAKGLPTQVEPVVDSIHN